MIQTTEQIEKEYQVLPTMKLFHESTADIRCISGPVGSGKTSAAACEICAFIPEFLFAEYGLTKTRWVVVRNFYRELMDTTFRTIREWFPEGSYLSQQNIYILTALNTDRSFRWEVELLFRSCDRPEDVAKFKSLEITGYWCDESIEIKEETKLMLKTASADTRKSLRYGTALRPPIRPILSIQPTINSNGLYHHQLHYLKTYHLQITRVSGSRPERMTPTSLQVIMTGYSRITKTTLTGLQCISRGGPALSRRVSWSIRSSTRNITLQKRNSSGQAQLFIADGIIPGTARPVSSVKLRQTDSCRY